ncbi:MAG: response regulator [Pseudomonadota bacterium]
MTTILVIEDSGSFRMVIKIALEREGYRVLEAANGEVACAMLDGRPIDVILSDLNMPGMDGLTFVRHLRTTDYQATPVVMLTGVSQVDKKAEGSDLGVVAWIVKPFKPQQLIDAIQEVIPSATL